MDITMTLRNKQLGRGEECYICLGEATDTHEIFNGSNRPHSIKYGMQLKLCRACHKWWHEYSTRIERDIIKAQFQQKFIEEYPDLNFYDIFKKNYL